MAKKMLSAALIAALFIAALFIAALLVGYSVLSIHDTQDWASPAQDWEYQ